MTDRLDEEIRSTLGSMIDEAPEPMELDQIAMQAAIATVPRQRRSPVPAIAVAFATVVVVVGAISLLASPREDDAVPLTTIPADAPVTATTPPPDLLSSSSWTQVPHDEAVFGGEMEAVFGGATMNSVTVGGPGLVAVGSANSAPAVWTSVDGITWSRVPHNEAVGGGSMSSVTSGGPGLVAVGSFEPNAAVRTSADGVTWSRVPNDEAVFGGVMGAGAASGGATMNSVTAGGPGLVAVGSEDIGAAVWTSVDGITWSRVPYNGAFGAATMQSVTVAGPGLIAVGGSGPAERGSCITTAVSSCSGQARVWISPDGITWSRVPSEAVGDGLMRTVIVRGSVLISVGGSGSHAAVWVSQD